MSAIIEAQLISSPMIVPLVDDLPPLTFKQSNFVKLYIDPANMRNGTECARLAGYEGNDVTLASVAAENLRKPQIQAHIQHALKLRHISPDEVLAELADVSLVPLNKDLQEQTGVRVADKLKALELAGKYHKLWDKSETELDSSPESAQRVAAALVPAIMAEVRRARELKLAGTTDTGSQPDVQP